MLNNEEINLIKFEYTIFYSAEFDFIPHPPFHHKRKYENSKSQETQCLPYTLKTSLARTGSLFKCCNE